MPRFSIVIPSYGNARYLPACLDSIRLQDCSDWEAVVVIDASPDNSLEIAREYAGNDERFVVVNKLVNEGRHLARKTGVEVASGDFILFLDADDELLPGTLSSLSDVVESTNADIVHFGLTCEGCGTVSESVLYLILRAAICAIGTLLTGCFVPPCLKTLFAEWLVIAWNTVKTGMSILLRQALCKMKLLVTISSVTNIISVVG